MELLDPYGRRALMPDVPIKASAGGGKGPAGENPKLGALLRELKVNPDVGPASCLSAPAPSSTNGSWAPALEVRNAAQVLRVAPKRTCGLHLQ